MRRRKNSGRKVRRITKPNTLKRLILSEARKINEENLGNSDPMEPLKADASEYQPGEEASQLEKDIDHLKALKIEERRLVKKLKRLKEVRNVIKKRMVRSL